MIKISKFRFSHTFRPAKLANLSYKFDSNKQLTLLVLHGMMGSKSNFRSIVKAHEISNQLKECHLVDLRNHGDTEHTSTMTYAELALDIKSYIDQNNLNDVVLMGHSFGGRNIFAYLEHHLTHAKQHVKGVVIVDITPTPPRSMTKDLLVNLNKIDMLDRTYKQLQKDIQDAVGNSESSKEIAGLVMTNIKAKNLTIDYTNKQDFLWRVNLTSLINSFEEQSSYDFKCDWRAPALVICGDRSTFVHESDRILFKQVFPFINTDQHIHFVPQSGHWVHAEKPREFIKLVGQFLKNLY